VINQKKVLAILVGLSLAMGSSHAQTLDKKDLDLSFDAAFPRAFYEKKYFGLAVTGASIVAAGALTYVTIGGGAPVAAMGVSTVASWVGGGGAGSYMAGLSTIGGWFGGNAIVGASILNGISLGTVGGPASWAALTAAQKAAVMSNVSAMALDGVNMFSSTSKKTLVPRVSLPVPRALADKRLKSLLDSQTENRDVLLDLSRELQELPVVSSDPKPSAQRLEIERKLKAAVTEGGELDKQILNEVRRVEKNGDSHRNLLVLAVLAHNLGENRHFESLLQRINPASLKGASYHSYLRAVAAAEKGDFRQAIALSEEARVKAPWAIEPPILLVNLLGAGGFNANRARIQKIQSETANTFDDDKYMSPLNLVSLHYRAGTLALAAKRFDDALSSFDQALSGLTTIDKYVRSTDTRNLLEIAKANALIGQGKVKEAQELASAALKRASKTEQGLLCLQYVHGCKEKT
jgi:tetratricopeptide (TPR) repeat protein